VSQPAVENVRLNLHAEWLRQFDVMLQEMRGRNAQPPANEVLRRDAMVLPHDRDPVDIALRRTEALLADIKRLGPLRNIEECERRLAELAQQACRVPPVPPPAPTPPPRSAAGVAVPVPVDIPSDPFSVSESPPGDEPVDTPAPKVTLSDPNVDALAAELDREWTMSTKKSPAPRQPEPPKLVVQKSGPPRPATSAPAVDPRRALFIEICKVTREIALANPLLDFDRLLFLKCRRSRPGHICDQYFGAKVGACATNGVFVLKDPFGAEPVAHDILASATVQNGRLAGRKLEGGSFLSPDVSWDGTEILFAYVECSAPEGTVTLDSRKGIWHEQASYHIFRANADGTKLRQLTDGNWNDFDPCWLPNGRIVFISERRGGYGRCHGRPVPTYTLHSMNGDGSDIIALSYHETNEWNPSVNHDGWIVYTRWDYVDRGDCIAHHPWITTPDGRAARAIQGNYPVSRSARPDAEHHMRAIPGSTRYVATATPHHGQSFGSLIMVDPNIPDDGAMSPLKRITPDNGFPETQGGRLLYGTAWPLSEDYYICVHGRFRTDSIYLIDSFGNQILLYAGDSVECLSPMPLRPRTRPPVYPHSTLVGKPSSSSTPRQPPKDATQKDTAQVACINVYEGLLPWPEGTRIASLRVIQLFPKATPNRDNPPISKWAESLVRGVVGTVPVESDGSAYFEAPTGKTLYFQALDEKGRAVQSMQSAVYFHPGERLTCLGCHEPRHSAPKMPQGVPLALRRAPSVPQPELKDDAAYPVSFPRLVQPVLDAKCVACHAKNEKAPPLAGGIHAQQDGRTTAYISLAKYGFGRSGKPPSRGDVRTVPGKFGAMAAPLYKMLTAGHKDVKLQPDEMHRITLWLDSNCNFYGAYFDTESQIAGNFVMPDLE
jgi:hypothetical protein